MLQLREVAIKVARGCETSILIRARTLIPSGLGVEGVLRPNRAEEQTLSGKMGDHGKKKN